MSLWGMEVIAAASAGRSRPPLWHGVLADPMETVVRRLVAFLGVTAELYLPFVAAAVVLIATGQSDRSSLLDVIGGSPVMTVLVFTAGLVYLPAVTMLVAASSATRIRDMLNPRYVVSAIRLMEGEYLAALGFIGAMLCTAWGVSSMLGFVPFAAKALVAAVAAYTMLAGGLVFGRLHSRFKEQLEEVARPCDPVE
jgi:hypothetical protein